MIGFEFKRHRQPGSAEEHLQAIEKHLDEPGAKVAGYPHSSSETGEGAVTKLNILFESVPKWTLFFVADF